MCYAASVRFLLVNNHCLTNPTAGSTHSLRTMLTWLAKAGHTVHALTTARFESPVPFTIDEHLADYGVEPSTDPVVTYTAHEVPITLLKTSRNDERQPCCNEAAKYQALVDSLLRTIAPDVVIACNAHPMIQQALATARAQQITTVFTVRGFNYTPQYFTHVDHVFTCSQFLTDWYRRRIGLESTPIEPPIEWRSVLAPFHTRAFVTFVHPVAYKGLWWFARLADVLNRRRPDIPLLIVQSGRTAGMLNAIPGLSFARAPQIMVAPHTPIPAHYLALTRLLLVPSVWPEPFGRVAAEAMINGIPPIVSDRGALPSVVGEGGRVLPLPSWLSETTLRLPTAREVEPWVRVIEQLWDNPESYQRLATRARQVAVERYSETVSRPRHVDYLTSLRPRTTPLVRDSSPPK